MEVIALERGRFATDSGLDTVQRLLGSEYDAHKREDWPARSEWVRDSTRQLLDSAWAEVSRTATGALTTVYDLLWARDGTHTVFCLAGWEWAARQHRA